MARALDQFPTSTADELITRKRTLERRLEDGYQRIELAVLDGQDVEAWERFWVRMLHEYEALCDGLTQSRAA